MAESRFLMAGSFIDGSGGTVRRNVCLAIREGCIAAICSADNLPRHAGAVVDDYSHGVIVPALVDCSVSLSRSPSVDSGVRLAAEGAGPEKKAAMLAQHVRYCHSHGVLGVADSDDPAGLVARHRETLAQRGGITIRTSGRLYRQGDECEISGAAAEDFLKIGYTANIEEGECESSRLRGADMCRMLAGRGGKKAVVVANGPQQVAEALAAGCDAIEQGYAMGEANLRTMAERGVLWIPNVLRAKNALDGAGGGGDVACRFSTRYVAPGKPVPGAEAFWKRVLAGQIGQLSLARKLGVETAVGTGAGGISILHGESVVEEMKLFLRAGYSLSETIRCASVIGAEFFGMENMGELAVGRRATFLITRGSVQQLPRKLAYLETIYVDGVPSGLYRKHPVREPFPAERNAKPF